MIKAVSTGLVQITKDLSESVAKSLTTVLAEFAKNVGASASMSSDAPLPAPTSASPGSPPASPPGSCVPEGTIGDITFASHLKWTVVKDIVEDVRGAKKPPITELSGCPRALLKSMHQGNMSDTLKVLDVFFVGGGRPFATAAANMTRKMRYDR